MRKKKKGRSQGVGRTRKEGKGREREETKKNRIK